MQKFTVKPAVNQINMKFLTQYRLWYTSFLCSKVKPGVANNSIVVKTQAFFASYSANVFLLLLGLVAVSFSSIFIHQGEQDLSSNSVVFSRFWMTTIIYGFWMGLRKIRHLYREQKTDEQPENTSVDRDSIWNQYIVVTGIVLGFCFCANQVIWSWSLEHTSIANSTILHNLTPIFTALGAYIFLNQHFDRQFILGMLLAIGGAVSIEVADLSFAIDRFQGDLAALASAVLYSGYLVAIEKLRDKLDIVSIVLGCCLIGCVMVFPLLLINGDSFFPHTINGWLSAIGLAVICQAIGQALIAYCLQTIPSGVVALSHLLCPCMTAIEAWLIFNQTLSIENLLGFTIIIIGLYVGLSSSVATK